jgi:hypothetical protein
MTTDEISSLKNEILKQNTIIAALIQQIEILKKENESLKKGIPTPNAQDAISNSDIGAQNIQGANLKSGNGTNNVQGTIQRNENGTNNVQSTIPKNENGTNNVQGAIHENENGTNNVQSTIPGNENGTNNVQTPIQGNGNGTKSVIASNSNFYLPSIEDNHINRNRLATALHRLLPLRAGRDKAYHVAIEILLLHNSGHATSDELRKATGLSKPGFKKHLPKVKRHGFIYKAGYKKYMLTNESKQILLDVFGGRNV